MRTILRASYLALVTVLLGASPSPTASPAPALVVHIKNFAYVPARLSVRAGSAVRFVNDDDDAHTVTAVDRSFDSAGLDSGDTWDHTFAKPGTHTYFCALHPYMKGSVVVMKGNQP